MKTPKFVDRRGFGSSRPVFPEIPETILTTVRKCLESRYLGHSKECKRCGGRKGPGEYNLSLSVNGSVRWPDTCYACGQAAYKDLQAKTEMLGCQDGYSKKKFAEDLRTKEGRPKKRQAAPVPDVARWDNLGFLVSTLVDLATSRERARSAAIAKRINWVPYFKAKDKLAHFIDQFVLKVRMKDE